MSVNAVTVACTVAPCAQCFLAADMEVKFLQNELAECVILQSRDNSIEMTGKAESKLKTVLDVLPWVELVALIGQLSFEVDFSEAQEGHRTAEVRQLV